MLLCLWVAVSLTKDLYLYLLDSTEIINWGRNEGCFTEILDNVLQEIKADSQNSKQYYNHHCLSENIHTLHSTFMMAVHFIRLLSGCLLFPENDIHKNTHAVFHIMGMEEYIT